jgi:tRNA pseudouridine38-40 synthase
METRTLQLVLQYDGTSFAGWQRQLAERTVQGVLEDALETLCGAHVTVYGAGRTDAGVHATGQSAGVRVADKWTAITLRKALNAVLPKDVWVAQSREMHPDFHARFSAVSRSYRYLIATGLDADSPFRRNREVAWKRNVDRRLLDDGANLILGDNCFKGFAVRGTAPDSDDHRCTIIEAAWSDREGGLVFFIKANRFLHHMVRFLVGTMLDVASGRRDIADIRMLLNAGDNQSVSPPAPAHWLYLENVEYPRELYLADA